mgnify:CR=1 FL=1
MSDQPFDMKHFIESFGFSVLEIVRESHKLVSVDGESKNRQPVPSPALNSIRPFSGQKGENLLAWSFQTTDVFDAYKVCLEDRLRLVSGLLRDAALQWYLNLRQNINKEREDAIVSWDDFLRRIHLSFDPPNSDLELRRQLRSLRQTSTIED